MFDSCHKVYLDGSGGIFSSDPRIRTCGWAWVQVHEQDPLVEIGQYGALPGKQTVPRSETAALLHFLKFYQEHRPGEEAQVYADATSTIYGWRSLDRKANECALWNEIRQIKRLMDRDNTRVVILKVESHPERPRPSHPNGIDQDPVLTFGNDRADHWAGKGAEIHCLGTFRGNYTSWIDATATTIQKRLLKVMELREHHRKTGDSLYVIPPNQYDESIKECGHDVITEGQYHRCIRCCQTWHHTKRRQVIQRGRCPGPGIWGIPSENLDIPRKLVHGYTLSWEGSTVHSTHNLGYTKGLLFCWGCGSYSSGKRVVGLNFLCPMKPRSAAARTALKRIGRGLHPDSRKTFKPANHYPPPPSWLDGG